jgi:uncharacterized membrane protein
VRSTIVLSEDNQENMEEGLDVSRRFFLLFIIGFSIIFAGIIIVIITALLYGSGSASFGAVIFVGPFPIVIGAGPEATLMVLFGIILAVLSVIVFLIMNRRIGKAVS